MVETAIGVLRSLAKSITPLPTTTTSSNWLASGVKEILPTFPAPEKATVFGKNPTYEITNSPFEVFASSENLPSKSVTVPTEPPFTDTFAPGSGALVSLSITVPVTFVCENPKETVAKNSPKKIFFVKFDLFPTGSEN